MSKSPVKYTAQTLFTAAVIAVGILSNSAAAGEGGGGGRDNPFSRLSTIKPIEFQFPKHTFNEPSGRSFAYEYWYGHINDDAQGDMSERDSGGADR